MNHTFATDLRVLLRLPIKQIFTMKSVLATSSLVTLLSTTIATPTTLRHARRQIGGFNVGPVCTSNTQPSAQDVVNALNTWLTDVKNVNSFLNDAPNEAPGSNLGGLARGALNNAMDEPTQLGTLACIPALTDAAEAAITSAANGFMTNVLQPLMDIVVNSADQDAITADLQQINVFRCCTLLPDLDVLWTAAATDEGVADQVDLTVPRPDACATTTCI